MRHQSDKSVLDFLEEHAKEINVLQSAESRTFEIVWTHPVADVDVKIVAPSLREAAAKAIEVDERALREDYELA
jgi:hypothetical protein